MWFQVVLFVVSLVVSWLTRPKSNYDSPSPGTVETGAVAEEGNVIPVLFGTRNIEGMNVVWYGDVRVIPIKKKGGKK
jgi:hypothetical protein